METQSTLPVKRNWAWIWLAYTGFLFIDPMVYPSLYKWLGSLLVFGVFVGIMAVYIRACDAHRPLRFWMIGATFVLGLITFPWNPGASTFFVYTAAFLPFNIASVRRVLTLFAVEALLILAEGYLFHSPSGWLHYHQAFLINWPNTFIGIFLLVIIGGGNIFFAAQKRADGRLRDAQQENIALAAMAERERIARDLHDVLGHTLSVIVLKAELAGRLIERDPARATAEIGDVERTARTALAEVREAIGGYRTRGLVAEIEAARRTLDAAGVMFDCDTLSEGSAALSVKEETVLALSLREAVTNIVRHAHATRCTLRFITDRGVHRLLIEDDGHTATAAPREGNGLRGMRERVESLGGDFRFEQSNGTRLAIELPARAATA